MISVVIPLYNKAEFITRTIESVLVQTFQSFEIVVVNDGSTDGSVEAVEAIVDSRIRIIHQENGGVSSARNNGIEEARFEWIALLDGDDIWKPEYLQTQWDLHLKYSECDVCACNYEFCDHTGKVTPTRINKLPFEGEDGILTNYFEVASCSHPPLWTSAIMAKRSAFLTVGGFPVGVKSGEDLLTWARLAVKYKIAYSIYSKAVFQEQITAGIPKVELRRSEEDTVLNELFNLHSKSDSLHLQSELQGYISHWCIIQSVIFLELKESRKCRNSIINAIRFGGYKLKPIIILFLSYLPPLLSLSILKLKKR